MFRYRCLEEIPTLEQNNVSAPGFTLLSLRIQWGTKNPIMMKWLCQGYAKCEWQKWESNLSSSEPT